MKTLVFIVMSVLFTGTLFANTSNSINSVTSTTISYVIENPHGGTTSNDITDMYNLLATEGHELKKFFRKLSRKIRNRVNYYSKKIHYHAVFIIFATIMLFMSFYIPFLVSL